MSNSLLLNLVENEVSKRKTQIGLIEKRLLAVKEKYEQAVKLKEYVSHLPAETSGHMSVGASSPRGVIGHSSNNVDISHGDVKDMPVGKNNAKENDRCNTAAMLRQKRLQIKKKLLASADSVEDEVFVQAEGNYVFLLTVGGDILTSCKCVNADEAEKIATITRRRYVDVL